MAALQTLVVDDSLSARTVLKRLLERKGAQVDMTESGFQALDYLKSHTPDVIFMDHTMPGMSGLDAVKAMRQNPATASIPVIMYTSHSDENYHQTAMENGASGIIPKPATWNKIADALESIVPKPSHPDSLAVTIDQELTSLRDHLSFTMERQIELLHEELSKEIESMMQRAQSGKEAYTPTGLSNLIHTVTDSKLHQMNLEMRQHMTAKMDVLLQDMKDEQRAFQQDIIENLNQRLLQLETATTNGANQRSTWLHYLPHKLQNDWSNIPVWIACAVILAMLISWPT